MNERCFAINTKGKCTALVELHRGCGTKKCPFYKPASQQKAELKKAEERCNKLGIPYGKNYRDTNGGK